MDITPDDFPEIRWHGHWIWTGDSTIEMGSPAGWDRRPRPPAHGLFRRSFELASVPERVPARITADSRYMLFVNGQRVGYGPIRGHFRRLSYDMYDLAPYLQAGRNTIAVLVKYYGRATSDWMPAVGNARLGKSGVMVFEADLGAEWLVSDATWKSRTGSGWLDDTHDPKVPEVVAGVPVESFDARQEDPQWVMPGFDDAAWVPAQPIVAVHFGARGRSQPPTDPYGPLLPRGIAHLTGRRRHPVSVKAVSRTTAVDLTPIGPAARVEAAIAAGDEPAEAFERSIAIPKGGHGLVRFDMGSVTAGFVDFAITAPAGAVVEFHFTEVPAGNPGPFGAHGGNRYVARGHDDVHRVFDKKGFRYAYLLIHSAEGEVAVNDFSVEEHLYPTSEETHFVSSDPELDRLYTAGRRTVALNAWDAFIDCPSREQRAWAGDAVVHQMVHLATNTDWRLARRYIELSDSPRADGILPMSVAGDVEAGEGFTIPDWSLHWLHGLWNIYRHTGDRDFIKAHMPSAERILRWYLPYFTRADVLQDVVEWNLVDWSALYSEAQSAIVTALWARGLKEFAEMAQWLGEQASAAWAQGLHARCRVGFELFWDESRGLYVDHAVDSVVQVPVNQLAGALAIVSGLAPKERWERIIAAITDENRLVVRSWMFPGAGATPEKAGASFRQMILGGLSPDWDVETEIVRAEPFMSYVVHDAVAMAGHAGKLPDMLMRWHEFLTDGHDTFGENWGTGTRVHGWSSTPARDLAAYVLGVSPAEPGYASARIAPRPGRLDWVEGAVPCPQGVIQVSVRDGTLSIESPVPVLVDLPGNPEQRHPAGRTTINLN
jgi:alpha-L-rhamnosidase